MKPSELLFTLFLQLYNFLLLDQLVCAFVTIAEGEAKENERYHYPRQKKIVLALTDSMPIIRLICNKIIISTAFLFTNMTKKVKISRCVCTTKNVT